MTLTVEDGTIVAGANTYLTEAEANIILADFGYTLTPATAEADLRTAAQYLESFRESYQGMKVDSTQALQWPRNGVVIDCFDIASTTIPNEVKYAQALAAYENGLGNKLQANTNGQTIIEKTVVGAVSVKYADSGQDSGQLNFSQIDSYIQPLLENAGQLVVSRL